MNCSGMNEIEGIQVIPVDAKKRPIPKGWQTTITKYDLSNVAGVGLVCGAPSGNLTALDLDLKYDETGTLLKRYKEAVHVGDKNLLKKLVVQKTRNQGVHFIFRCNEIEGNQKLANRHTTENERKETYNATYAAEIVKEGVDDAAAKIRAEKAANADKVRVLIETRGIGGQIVIAPSTGYEFIYGDLCSIVEITKDERNILFSVARSFNEVFEEVIVPKTTLIRKTKGLSVFEDYNERGDVVGLLQSNGWKVVSQKGHKTHLLRPGQSTAETSGNFDHDLNRFSVFTTSTEFEPNKGYMRYAVFAVLECGKDFSMASKRLYEMGYGERDEMPKEKPPSTRVIQSRVDVNDGDLSFLAVPADYDGYLETVIDGTVQMGLTTGSLALDQYFMRKKGGTEGSFVMTNGHDNTGKSIFMFWLQLLAAMYHGWKGVVFASENTIGGFMRKMVQFYWGKPLRGYNAMTRIEYQIAKKFVEDHFRLIKAQEDLYNYKDILNMVKKTIKVYPDLDWAMIDPYNSLKTDLSGFSKLSTHDYHYEALSEMKSFGQVNNFGWVINHHAVTESLRKVDKEGYPVAPNKADTEGGNKVPAKADDFLTIHRKTQHPTDWMITEVHVRKVKDTETGGRPTPLDAPVLFRMNKNGCGFTEKLPLGGLPIDPVQRWHQTKNATSEEEKHWADRKGYQTLEQFKEAEYAMQCKTEIIATIPKSDIDGYEPDDEEKQALAELLKEKDPF